MSFAQRIATCPAAYREAINARLEAATHPVYGYSYGPGNVSIPLSADGEDPATHFASCAQYDGPMLAQLNGLRAAYPTIQVFETWAAVEAAGLRRIIPPATI